MKKKCTCGVIICSLALASLSGCSPVLQNAEKETTEKAVVKVESDLFGEGYTRAKSTLKKEFGGEIDFGGSSATFTIEIPNNEFEPDKLDASQAKITLEDGDGYYASQFDFEKKLTGKWNEDGEYILTLDPQDLTVNNQGYLVDNGGMEWSAIGGDGKGLYYLNMNLSGLAYDGEKLDDAPFRTKVQVYGYDYTQDAEELYDHQEELTADFKPLSIDVDVKDEPIWTWIGTGEEPILCDNETDDIYISWPESTDPHVGTDDVSIILQNEKGDSLLLKENEDYVVRTDGSLTQIALTYKYYPFAPVFTEMKVIVDQNSVENIDEKIEQIFDVDSVYVNMVQTGGGNDQEGTVVTIAVYGIEPVENLEQLGMDFFYILETQENGTKKYYKEEDGKATLTENEKEATAFDGTEEMDAQLKGNIVYFTEHFGATEKKKVDGKEVEFTKSYKNTYPLYDKVEASKGYVIPENMMEHHKWAWADFIKQGWTSLSVFPEGNRFEIEKKKGDSQSFEVATDSKLEWSITGNQSKDTKVDQKGNVTIGSDEEANQISVAAENEDGEKAAVGIKIIKE